MNQIQKIGQKLKAAQHQVEQLEKEFAELRLAALQQVKVTKNGETMILTFGNRALKVKRHARYYRLNVYENGKKIVSEYPWGIHDLRFAISQNKV
jgi:hypothetical protein